MTDRELMQQALEALEAYRPVIVKRYGLTYSVGDKAITVLRERLAQPEQEPVAWMTPTGALYRTEDVDGCFDDTHIPLYTTPPQRKPWVGLTDEEIEFIYADTGYNDIQMFARAIEAAHGIKGEA